MQDRSFKVENSLNFLAQRRSVFPRDFTPINISEEEIHGLLEAARYAPTHKITEPWRFVVFKNSTINEFQSLQSSVLKSVIEDDRLLESKLEKLAFKCEKSAAIIAIILKRDPSKRVPVWEEISAVSCAVQNIWLHARSFGLGGYWSSGNTTDHARIREEFNLSDEDMHLGWFFLGGLPLEERRERNRKEVSAFVTLKD